MKTLRTPGSKSIYIRTLALALLNKNPIEILNPSQCEDAYLMENIVQQMGAKIHKLDSKIIFTPPTKIKPTNEFYDVGNSGFVSRLMMAVLSFLNFPAIFKYGDQLFSRPSCPHFSQFWTSHNNLKTKKSDCALSDNFHIETTQTSQFLSSAIIGSLFFSKDTLITFDPLKVSQSYLDLTLKILTQFKAKYILDLNQIKIFGSQNFSIDNFDIENDATNLSYFVFYKILHQKPFQIKIPTHPAQGDWNLINLLTEMGVKSTSSSQMIKFYPPYDLHGCTINCQNFPDLFPTLCALLSFAHGTSTVIGGQHLSLKESNRLESTSSLLSFLNVPHKLQNDGITLLGTPTLNPEVKSTVASSFDDHRIAMLLSVLQTKFHHFRVDNLDCIKKSYSTFFQDLEAVQ